MPRGMPPFDRYVGSARSHPERQRYKALVLEQLAVAGPVTAKLMFGGVGLYCQGLLQRHRGHRDQRSSK
jgi:hypothetical protein